MALFSFIILLIIILNLPSSRDDGGRQMEEAGRCWRK